MKIIVSVIIPLYNSEKYIDETIKSVLNQNLKEWELIIVDDLSEDRSFSIAEKWAKKDKRIHVYRLKRKGYKSKACNKAIALARGKYISILDADDLFHKDKLRNQIEFLKKHPEISLVFGKTRLFGEDSRNTTPLDIRGKNLREILKKRASANIDKLRVGCFLGLKGSFGSANQVMKKEIFEKCKFDENLKRSQDYDLYFQIIGKGYKIGYLAGKSLYYYRIHKSQSIRNRKEMNKARNYILKKLRAEKYFK